MHRYLCVTIFAIGAGMLISSLPACTTNPFEPTTDLVSSTSGRAWWNEDGLIRPEHKAIAFATYNRANLEQDIAKGRGEYLSSLGTLIGVTDDSQPSFQARAQREFQALATADHETRIRQLRILNE